MNVSNIGCNLCGFIFDRYMFFMVIGIVSTVWAFTVCRPKDFPFGQRGLFFVGTGLAFASFFGAHAMHVIINYPRTKDVFWSAMISMRGFTYIGAPILGITYLWAVSWLRRIPFSVLADYIMPFLMIERAVGRIGCFFYGCCRGIPTDLPWACSFFGGPRVHPTQVYEIIYATGIFVAARYVYKRAGSIPYLSFFFTAFCYSLFRLCNEFLRVEGPFMFGTPVKWSYLVYAAFSILFYVGMTRAYRRVPPKDQPCTFKRLMQRAFLRMATAMLVSAAVILPVIVFVIKGTLVK